MLSPPSAVTKDIRWLVGLFPRHESFVELTGGYRPLLLAKTRSMVEVLNDRSGQVVNLYRVLRDAVSAKQLAEAVRGTIVPGLDLPAAIQRALKFSKGCRDSLRASHTQSWKFGDRFRECFNESTVIFEPLIRRLCGTQIENLTWDDALHRYDSAQAFFIVNLDSWAGSPTDRLRFSDSPDHREQLFQQLALIEGKACVYSRLLSDIELPNSWHLHRQLSHAAVQSNLRAWTNYKLTVRRGVR